MGKIVTIGWLKDQGYTEKATPPTDRSYCPTRSEILAWFNASINYAVTDGAVLIPEEAITKANTDMKIRVNSVRSGNGYDYLTDMTILESNGGNASLTVDSLTLTLSQTRTMVFSVTPISILLYIDYDDPSYGGSGGGSGSYTDVTTVLGVYVNDIFRGTISDTMNLSLNINANDKIRFGDKAVPLNRDEWLSGASLNGATAVITIK